MSLQNLCNELNLSTVQCKVLGKRLNQVCGKPATGTRRRSKWQECIAVRRKGKPFDPQAIKSLAEEYRAGRCP